MAEFDITTNEGFEEQFAGGSETDWQPGGEIIISSGFVLFGDATSPMDGKQLPLPSGSYSVGFREYFTPEYRWVSRARIVSRGDYDYDCNERSYAVDSAHMCIADYDGMRRVHKKCDEAVYWPTHHRVMAADRPCFLEWTDSPDSRMWVVPSGFGDGLYDIFSLRAGDTLIGYETIFMGANPSTKRPRPKRVLP